LSRHVGRMPRSRGRWSPIKLNPTTRGRADSVPVLAGPPESPRGVRIRAGFYSELKNITEWATTNNLTLNLSKSVEIVFVDKNRKCGIPNVLDGLGSVQNIKMLSVTFNSQLHLIFNI